MRFEEFEVHGVSGGETFRLIAVHETFDNEVSALDVDLHVMSQNHDGPHAALDIRRLTGDGDILGTDGNGLSVLFDEVHFANKGCHILGCGVIVDLRRSAYLFKFALVHDHDAVGQGHGLFLIVGHEYHGDAQFGLNLLQLFAHLLADFGVQSRERLIQQQYGGLEQQGTNLEDIFISLIDKKQDSRKSKKDASGFDETPSFDIKFPEGTETDAPEESADADTKEDNN